jgi:hypothetical protein
MSLAAPRTMAVKVMDRLFLVVFGTADPTDPEWVAYLKLVESHGVDRTMQLILTDGGEPTPMQRRRLNALVAGRAVPTAIVSGSARIRGTVTALSWFNRTIKSFPPSGLREAIAYLELPVTRMELIERESAKLRAVLQGGDGIAIPEPRPRGHA